MIRRAPLLLVVSCSASAPPPTVVSNTSLETPPPVAIDAPAARPEQPMLTGVVTLDGAPVSHYGVTLVGSPSDYDYPRAIEVRADDGRFTVPTPFATAYGLIFSSAHFAPHYVPNVTSVEHAVTDLGTIAVARGITLAGRVTDALGNPLADVPVQITRRFRVPGGEDDPLSLRARRMFATRTDARGAYRLEHVGTIDAAESLVIAAVAKGAVASWPIHVPDRDATRDLAARPVGAITGTLGPVHASASSIILTPLPPPKPPMSISTNGGTDTFRFDDVPVGRYQLTLSGRGMPHRIVTVTTGATTTVAFP